MFLTTADVASKSLWEFTVVAAVVSATTTLLALFFKEVVTARSFELWKQRQNRRATYEKYRAPLLLSAIELCSRTYRICDEYPPKWLSSAVLLDRSPHMTANAEEDPYYLR